VPFAHKIKLARDTDLAISSSDIVLGTYSTMLYDAVRLGCPVAILETSIDYGDGMVINGLADMLSINSDVHANLERLSGMPEKILRERRNKLTGEDSLSLVRTIVELLRQKT
jgi:hypothetical protein